MDPESVVARYRDGAITRADFDAWLAYLRANGRSTNPTFAIRNLVLVRTLAARFEGEESGAVPIPAERDPRQAQRVYKARQTANARLDRVLTEAAIPTETAVRSAFDAEPERYSKPKRWRLSNIFLRVESGDRGKASTGDRQQARERLEALRKQVLAGADFATLARAESHSETRLRGGDLGFTSLNRLHPAIARAVSRLSVDEVSEVIDTDDGVTLLRCTAILEPAQLDYAAARRQVESRLREDRYERIRDGLDDELVASMNLRIVPLEPAAAPGTRTVEARFRFGDEERTLTTEALASYLRLYGVRKPIDAFGAEKRQTFIRDCLLHEARAQEAKRRGLLEDAAFQASLVFQDLEIRAQLVANRASAEKNISPSKEAIASFYARRQAELIEPQAQHIRMVAVARDPSYGAAFYRALRESAARLAASRAEAGSDRVPAREGATEASGATATHRGAAAANGGADDLEMLARSLGGRGELRDLGWLTEVKVWQLGLNVDTAVAELASGQISPLIQQGRELYVLELVAERPERQLSLDEARPRIRAALTTAERRRIGNALRQQVLDEQRIRMIEEGE